MFLNILKILDTQPTDIWHDTFFQFVVIAIVTLIAGLIGAFVTYWIYRKQRSRKEISWQNISNTLVLPFVDVGEQVKGKLQIFFEGKPVSDLRLIVFKLWNSGNVPIDVKDYENNNPININFGEKSEILNVEILESEPNDLRPRAEASVKVDNGNINLEPLLLNSGDTVTFKVLLIKSSDELVAVSGRISGVKKILELDTVLERNTRSIVVAAIFGITALCLFTMSLTVYILNVFSLLKIPISTSLVVIFGMLGLVFGVVSVMVSIFASFTRWINRLVVR